MPLPTYNFNIMTSEILLKKSQLSTFIDLHKQAKKNREEDDGGRWGTMRTQMVNKLERDPDSIYAPFCRSSLSLLPPPLPKCGKNARKQLR